MKRMIALSLALLMTVTMLTGCGAKGDVKELLQDCESACQALDVERIAGCFNPGVVEPLMGVLGLFGVELSDLNALLSGFVGFADSHTDSELEELYRSLKISPQDYVFNDAKDACDVSAEVSYTVNGQEEKGLSVFHCEQVDGEWYIFSIR